MLCDNTLEAVIKIIHYDLTRLACVYIEEELDGLVRLKLKRRPRVKCPLSQRQSKAVQEVPCQMPSFGQTKTSSCCCSGDVLTFNSRIQLNCIIASHALRQAWLESQSRDDQQSRQSTHNVSRSPTYLHSYSRWRGHKRDEVSKNPQMYLAGGLRRLSVRASQ